MRTQSIRSWQLALLLTLGVNAFACGDDTSGGADDDVPDLTGNNGDGDNGGSEGENNGENNGAGNDGANNANGGNANAGTNAPEDTCVKEPKTSADFLNSCPPEGVERRAFDNKARLPSSYEPGKLPAL